MVFNISFVVGLLAFIRATDAISLLPESVVRNVVPKKESEKKPVAPLSVFQTMLSGGCARAISQAVTYPMDALRTISQTRKGAKKLSELGAGVLFSGAVQTSLFAFPLGAVQFTVFGNMKKAITSVVGPATGGIKGTAVAIASSACASLASCAVGVPQEILKQRLVTKIYPDFGTAVSTIWKSEGLKGFYVGWAPTVARNLPYVVITFTTFNHWKTQELKKREGTQSANLDLKTSLRFGMGAALIGCLATQVHLSTNHTCHASRSAHYTNTFTFAFSSLFPSPWTSSRRG
jgi:solute carrier family 25 S-adenosylmethionine transporter 26